MDKDGDKKGGDKKNSSNSNLNNNAALADQASLLDAASLFAYWGRDPSAMAAAASNPLFGSHFGGASGLGGLMQNAQTSNNNDRYALSHQHHNTMAVAASQAASLAGLHNASWWSMAQLAAQDYFARLQASGMSQMSQFSHPDLAGAFPGGLGMPGVGGGGAGGAGSSNSASGKSNVNNTKSSKKRERSSNSGSSNAGGNNGGNNNNAISSYKQQQQQQQQNSPSPSVSSASATAAYKQSLYSQATLHKELMAISAAAAAAQASGANSKHQKSSNSSHHAGSHHQSQRSSGSPSVNSSKSHTTPSVTISASQPNSSSILHQNHHLASLSRSKESNKNNNTASAADLGLSASINALNSLSHFGNLDLTTQQNVTATMNALAASSAKAKDYMSSGILNDPSSLLGVRLPPDTEIIKYTSSIVGPKVPGTTNRGRKKTISLDPNPFFAQMHGLSAAKRARLEAADFSNLPNAHQSDRIEVIKLPPTITSNGVYNVGKSSGKDTPSEQTNDWVGGGLNLSSKSSTSSTTTTAAEGNAESGEAPLNLSLKTEPKSRDASAGSTNSLQSLSSITAALGSNSGSEQRSRRKSDNKNRRSESSSSSTNNHLTNLGLNSSLSELLKISNYEEYDYSSFSSTQYKEGRPRNLGRGVSKPKKNTVASLLAQSRAVGSKPLTPQQLLTQEAELEKAMRQAMAEASQSMDTSNTDTESIAESGLSESEGEDQVNMKELRLPLERGWQRETIIRGLTKNGQIKGDVYYLPPNSVNKIKSIAQIQLYLDQFKPKDITRNNFSFSAKGILGTFLQPAPPPYATDGEYIKMTDVEVSRRLEELKLFTRHTTLGVEQRIEIAKQQQAQRDAKKLAKDEITKNKEKAKHAKEIERNERLEMQRREREHKNQQALEAKRKREEDLARQKLEEAQRKQQMYLQDLNKQKELLYAVELERERRRQHMALVKQLEMRRKYEDREKKKNQIVLDKLIIREKKLAMRKRDSQILTELRKPQEDSEIPDHIEMPTLPRVPGLKLSGTGYADLLMVFEFLHNFGETLGFDMESLPSLQSLHQALVSENAIDAEEELLSVMTHLLVCAIEDPGLPNPGRHTTLLGQTLRQADITHANVSEILRIYLYAVATGEVKQSSGINLEREKERRSIADHHSNEADILLNATAGKNSQFYEHLHENVRWKLSECLKDKPFVALNPSVKAQILAMLCNDLLLNKAVCKQIDGSLESQAQLKKERYLLDAKIRKYKSLVARKVRLEQYEKAQALALEKSLSLKIAEAANMASSNDNNNLTKLDGHFEGLVDAVTSSADYLQNHKEDSLHSNDTASIKNGGVDDSPSKISLVAVDDKIKELNFNELTGVDMVGLSSTQASSDIETILTKSIIHDAPSEKNDDENSDLESEGTQLEEDEDATITAEEAQKKYDKILETSFQNKQQLENALNQLRSKCFGQDRYWRRYWNLAKCGGVFVESMESTQSDIFQYNSVLEKRQSNPNYVPKVNHVELKRERERDNSSVPKDYCSISLGSAEKRKRGRPRLIKKDSAYYNQESANDSESQDDSRTSYSNCDENKHDIQSDDCKSIDDNNMSMMPAHSVATPQQQSLPQQAQQKAADDDLMDIEDSIPTAILVQKSNNIDETKIVEVNNQIGGVNVPPQVLNKMDEFDDTIQLDQVASPTVIDDDTNMVINDSNGDCDIKPKLENGDLTMNNNGDEDQIQEHTSNNMFNNDVDMCDSVKEDVFIKEEVKVVHEISEELRSLMEKWFSIVNKEIQLTSAECPNPPSKGNSAVALAKQMYTNITCKEIHQAQGNRWDIGNNIHFFNILVDKGCDIQFQNDSVLTTSGLSEFEVNEMVKKSIKPEHLNLDETDDAPFDDIPDVDLMKEMKPMIKIEQQQEELNSFSLPSYMNLTLNNLTAYVQCDNFQPLQMTLEEQRQLEEVKTHGMPRKVEKSYVFKDLRHGWWKINDIEQLNELIKSLHARGVREKNLRVNLLQSLSESVYLTTPHHVSHPRAPPPPNGYIEPECWNAWNPHISRRVELALLDQIEAMEDKIASASMQIKGWAIPQREGDVENGMEEVSIDILRERIIGLEGAIERRYLKPPLGTNTAEAQMAAIAQQECPSTQQNSNSSCSSKEDYDTLPKGLMSWRDAVERSNTTAQLSMALYVLESCVAWDKSIMKANCQFCQSGESEDKLLLCDGCDRGYHTYCFKPRMDKIPEGDWYCYECKNKATGDRKCIVCGGHRSPPYGKMIYCELCPRAYHQDCYIPPMLKTPRGKWYCQNCVSKAPPRKRGPRKPKELKSHNSSQSLTSSHDEAPLSPAHSVASSTFEEPQTATIAPESANKSHQSSNTNAMNSPSLTNNVSASQLNITQPEKHEDIMQQMLDEPMDTSLDLSHETGMLEPPVETLDLGISPSQATPLVTKEKEKEKDREEKKEKEKDKEKEKEKDKEKDEAKERMKQEKKATKKLIKELSVCKIMLEEMEVHEDSWPFLLPVNTKQFPTYRKVIKYPMDLSTIKKRLQDLVYKSREDFVSDVRQIFDNCERFNEDDSPVGTAGHGMRKYFEVRWAELTDKHS